MKAIFYNLVLLFQEVATFRCYDNKQRVGFICEQKKEKLVKSQLRLKLLISYTFK